MNRISTKLGRRTENRTMIIEQLRYKKSDRVNHLSYLIRVKMGGNIGKNHNSYYWTTFLHPSHVTFSEYKCGNPRRSFFHPHVNQQNPNLNHKDKINWLKNYLERGRGRGSFCALFQLQRFFWLYLNIILYPWLCIRFGCFFKMSY